MTIDTRFECRGNAYCLAEVINCKYFNEHRRIHFAGQYEGEKITYYGCEANEICRQEKKHETKKYCFVSTLF